MLERGWYFRDDERDALAAERAAGAAQRQREIGAWLRSMHYSKLAELLETGNGPPQGDPL